MIKIDDSQENFLIDILYKSHMYLLEPYIMIANWQ